MSKIAVIGAGGWGTALASVLTEKNQVILWVREPDLFNIMKEKLENSWFLPDVRLPKGLSITNDESSISGSDIVVFAVPSQHVRATAKRFAQHIDKNAIIICLSKGIELGTYKRMSQVLAEELCKENIVALSGPNHCEEVAKKMPTATVIAHPNIMILKKLKESLSTDYFRVYPHNDIVGVEICGSIKNITAIASGIVDGLGFGDNAKASIITYGLTEMNNFGRFFGAKKKTIYGLAGVGDLIATCTSKHSRNRYVGQKIAEGKDFEDIQEEMHGQVAEGITTCKSIYEFSQKNGISMPLTSQVYKVLFEKKELKEAIHDLIHLI